MKRLGELLLDTSGGSEIYMSNTAVVRAMIEEGIRVVSSYPGSPTPEIGSAILSIPRDKRPFYFEFSVNEKIIEDDVHQIRGDIVFHRQLGIPHAAQKRGNGNRQRRGNEAEHEYSKIGARFVQYIRPGADDTHHGLGE